MRGFILFTILLLVASPVHALYREGADSHGTYFAEDRRNYPVIFIPGVAGSELNVGSDNAWPGWLHHRATGGNFDKLAIDKNGKSKYSVTPVQSIRSGLEADLGGYGRVALGPDFAIGIYGGFFDYMEQQNYSIEEDLETGLRVYDFAYDWRVDNHRTADRLEVFIDEVLEETHSDRVIIFAHSMGGVVTRLYLADEKRAEKVGGVVFLGSPHQGSPKPFYAFVHGYNFGNAKLSDTTMWEIMGNWEAGYQLLANYPYIQDAKTGEFWPVEKIYGTDWISQQEYDHYIADPDNWELRYGLPNRKYAESVLAFQRELGDTLPDYPWIQYYMIEGTDQETTQYFEATLTEKPEVDKPVLSLVEVKTPQGDGTVPARGAKVEGLTRDASLVYTDHGSIPAWPGSHPLMTIFRNNINDEERRLQYSSDIWDYADGELDRVRNWPETGSVMRALTEGITSIWKPDEEKVRAREQLRGAVRQMVQWSRLTVIVAPGTEEEDSFFLVIDDLEIVDGDPGEVRPGTAKLHVDTWETLDGILSGSIQIEDAYRDGRVEVKGVSLVQRFQLLLAKWFAKFANRGGSGTFVG